MRRTYPDMSDREAQIIFMKVRIRLRVRTILELSSLISDRYDGIVNRLATSSRRLDTNCDGEVDLSEYLTYILFEHQQREIMYGMSKPMPYPTSPMEMTTRSLSLDLYIGVGQTLRMTLTRLRWASSCNSFRVYDELDTSSIALITPTAGTSPLHVTVSSRIGRHHCISFETRKFNRSNRANSKQTRVNTADSSILVERFLSGSPA